MTKPLKRRYSSYLGHEDTCPICFNKLDSATCVNGRVRPSPGDLTICLYCAELLVFDKSLRHACLDEHGGLEALAPSTRDLLLRAQKAIRESPNFGARKRGATS